MSEMIERVAIAIDQAVATWQPGSCMEPIKIMAARAAIEAMREPTGNMLFVGSNEDAGFTERNLLQSWRLMIDEALK